MAKGYWWLPKNFSNFGDLLTPLLFKKFANLTVERSEIKEADMLGVGSILDLVPAAWKGLIVGTGKLREAQPVDVSHAKVLAVRGPLTAASISGLNKEPVFGDLGLLADELVPCPEKEHALGLVPHWSDTKLEKRREFLQYKPLVIRTSDDPLHVIKQIGSCRKIVASSLHGVIIADAFGIPRRTEMCDQFAREGGDFKFRDHCATLEMPFEVGLTQQANYRAVLNRQHELYDVLMEATSLLRKV